MKNEKGITLISLVMTIILVFILASIGTYTGFESYENMRANAFVAKMIAVQEKVNNLCSKYTVEEIIATGSTIGVPYNSAPGSSQDVLTSVISRSTTESFKSWNASVDGIAANYRYFSKEDIAEDLGLTDFDVGIFVNPTTRNVIAEKGVKLNGVSHYRQYDLTGGQTLEATKTITDFNLPYTVKTYDNKAVITISPTESEIKEIKYEKKNSAGEYSDSKIVNSKEIEIKESGTYKVTVTADYGGATKSASDINITIANKPMLVAGMTPVKYNGSTWVNCTVDDKDWYNYDSGVKKWANVKLKDGSMYVWIPRFAYEIVTASKKINVKFLSGITNTSTDGKALASTYKVAPAFQNGSASGYKNGEWDAEITGFWVAKYETTNNSGKPKNVLVNAVPWNTIASNVAFSTCRKMEGEFFGTYFNTSGSTVAATNLKTSTVNSLACTTGEFTTDNNNFDTHLIKNSEWGAVTYLSHSIYGRNGSNVRGTSGDSNIQTLSGNDYSTNGNQTGIFGMSGGKYELVGAGVNITGYYNTENKSTKYATVYATGDIASSSNAIYGDGMKETKGWNSCTATNPSLLIIRGGYQGNNSGNGLFAYQNKDNSTNDMVTFRPTIIVEY